MAEKKMLLVQVIVVCLIFLLFVVGFFFTIKMLPYILIPLIIFNIVLLFINRTRGLITNINLLILSFLLFIVIIEYIATIAGMVLSLFHALRVLLHYVKGGEQPAKKQKAPKK